jgi:hypothetical protein
MDRGKGPAWGQPVVVENTTITTENGYTHTAQDNVSEQPTVRVASAIVTIEAGEKIISITPTAKRSEANQQAKPWLHHNLHIFVIAALTLVQTGLMIISFVPGSVAITLGWSSSNGPFPASSALPVTALFYLLPFIIGLLARRWDLALFGATAPVWLAVFVYSVGASSRNGIFYFLRNDEPNYLVGTVELFAALGLFGWLTYRVMWGNRAAKPGE